MLLINSFFFLLRRLFSLYIAIDIFFYAEGISHCCSIIIVVSFSWLVGLKKMSILLCFLENSWLTLQIWWGMTTRLYHLHRLKLKCLYGL